MVFSSITLCAGWGKVLAKARPCAGIFVSCPCKGAACKVTLGPQRRDISSGHFLSEISFTSRLYVTHAFALCCGLSGCFSPPLALVGPAIVPPLMLSSEQVQGCGHDQLAHLTGQPFANLANYRLPGQLRVLRPGQGVTRDLMADRLNAQVNGTGVILHLFCG
ncbi:MAG: I78 family peptidase inhibitor [Paracoccaceae bacterium]